MEHFRRAGATTPETAQTSSALGVDENFIWRRLADGAVIRAAPSGGYYLDEASWAALGRRRRRMTIAISITAIVLGVFAYLATILARN